MTKVSNAFFLKGQYTDYACYVHYSLKKSNIKHIIQVEKKGASTVWRAPFSCVIVKEKSFYVVDLIRISSEQVGFLVDCRQLTKFP